MCIMSWDSSLFESEQSLYDRGGSTSVHMVNDESGLLQSAKTGQ